MRDLAIEDFTEFKWLPFAVGIIALLYLRASVIGTLGSLVDVFVVNLYFSLFSLWSFGYKQLANFEVYSYPALASYAMGISTLLVATALVVTWRRARRELQAVAA